MSDEVSHSSQSPHATNADESLGKHHNITLYFKAGSDKRCLGCCPFSQRLFMILWLKGVVFNVTTIDNLKADQELLDNCSGLKLPILHINSEYLADIPKCVEYIEAELDPPNYPKLACKYAESNTIGDTIFAKFSAFIKCTGDRRGATAKDKEHRMVEAMRKLDLYLRKPLDHEIDADSADNLEESNRKFIDGNYMTLADCNMLPKLHILRVASRCIGFEIPAEFTGIHRYLAAAEECPEFKQTCPEDYEIEKTYGFTGRRGLKKN